MVDGARIASAGDTRFYLPGSLPERQYRPHDLLLNPPGGSRRKRHQIEKLLRSQGHADLLDHLQQPDSLSLTPTGSHGFHNQRRHGGRANPYNYRCQSDLPSRVISGPHGFADGADGVVQGLSNGQIEIKYTLNGDANLDGEVNGTDFNILAANFNQSITGWDQGDFNYDGLANAADFNELAANFNQGANLNAPGLVAGSGAIYTITGSPGAQTLDILSGTVTLTSDLSALLPNYSLQIENGASVVLASDQHISALQLFGSGSLDVNNYTMFINYGSNADPISAIAGYIKSGYNGGAWNGQGIISTAAQTPTNGLHYGLGYANGKDNVVSGLSSGQIEVKYTLLGDANLDGLVNGSDFNIVAANFNQSITGWDQGDFNYDGLVNAADFNELAANFNQGASGASGASSVAVLEVSAGPAVASTPATVTTSTIELTAKTVAAPVVVSATPTVATVATRSTVAAPPASKSTPVSVSKAVIAKGKPEVSAVTPYTASVVTIPSSGSTATPQNTNNKDAKFLADR
jgi:hypothetical protein